jgi:hypothetical protein
MKIGDPVMRVFKHGGNWIGIVTWVSEPDDIVKVKWAHNGLHDVHNISILTSVKKCP